MGSILSKSAPIERRISIPSFIKDIKWSSLNQGFVLFIPQNITKQEKRELIMFSENLLNAAQLSSLK